MNEVYALEIFVTKIYSELKLPGICLFTKMFMSDLMIIGAENDVKMLILGASIVEWLIWLY